MEEKSMKNNRHITDCPIQTVFNLIGNKWKILIIRDLLAGKKRFGALNKMTGASQKSLTTQLRELEEDEIIVRKEYAEIPPRVEYSLSDVGMSLAPILEVMAGWGTDYKKYIELKNKLQK